MHNAVHNSAARCCITLGTSYVAKYSLLQRTALHLHPSAIARPPGSIPGSGGFLNMATKWEADAEGRSPDGVGRRVAEYAWTDAELLGPQV